MQWSDLKEYLEPELWQRYQLLLRLLLAAALGGMIGLEREHSGKPAGFRTNMLICLGAALIMELSIGVAALTTTGDDPVFRADPGRLGAQIVSGIGFLGAGTILHFRGNVTGLTTAATLWVVAAIGMAVGSQAYIEAIGTTALVMLALMLLGRVEDHLIQRKPSERTIDLVVQPDANAVNHIEQLLLGLGFAVDTLRIEKKGTAYHVSFLARGGADSWRRVMQELLNQPGVQRVELV